MPDGPPVTPGPPAPAGGEVPNLRHLRLLVATVAKGSLTRAADHVHISQPAASQAMARLAEVFGARLLERAGNRIVPTPEGRIVAHRAGRALAHLSEAGRRLSRAQRGTNGGLAADLLERHATMPQLKALAAFAEAGSFSGAARALGQTEPSIQRASREVERIAGVALFDGSFRALRLTPAGETLSRHAALMLKEVAAAQAELREREGRFDGRLVVGTLPLVRTRIVPEAVVALTARYPEAKIEIVDGPYEQLAHSLRMGTCDLLVGALREGSVAPGLDEEVLFRDGLAIVARAGHPLAGHPLTGSDLAGYPWVLPRRDTPSRAILDRLMQGWGLDLQERGHVETGSLVALRGILTASDALTILSPRQIEVELDAGLLAVLDLALPPTDRPIGVSTLAGWQPTALGLAFLEELRRAAAPAAVSPTAPAGLPTAG
jgi:LysR family transcriptional regulator, regulator for genes of the gallate degradation pathway